VLRVIARSGFVLLAAAIAGSLVVFGLLRLLGGDVATVILGRGATPQGLAQLRAELGLDRSWYVQYGDWLWGLLRGDLGDSYAAGYDIFGEITSRMGLTVTLAVATLVLSAIVALFLGTYSALRINDARGTFIDVTTQLGIAVPTFWAGLLLIGFVSVQMGWLPASGYVPFSTSPVGAVRSLTLPVLAMSIPLIAVLARYVRSSMLDVLNEDYIRTARAKGIPLRKAARTHGIRNAAVPLVTVGTLHLGAMLAGAVVIEVVFTLPGLGRMLLNAVGNREVIVVQSLVFIILLMVLVLNFLMDIAYGFLDPRIRDAGGRTAK
jgi:peptide/nickel transport system permease protein